MPKMNAPAGVSAFSVTYQGEELHFEVVNGQIEVTDTEQETVLTQLLLAGATWAPPTVEEVTAAAETAVVNEKQALLATIREAGRVVDGRASLASLRAQAAALAANLPPPLPAEDLPAVEQPVA